MVKKAAFIKHGNPYATDMQTGLGPDAERRQEQAGNWLKSVTGMWPVQG